MTGTRSRILLVILAALAVSVFGVTRLIAALAAPAEVVAVAEVDGLKAQVTTATWSAMDHDDMGPQTGYQMPAQMMPGMPDDGQNRLVVSISVTNTSPDTRAVHPGSEFTLLTGDGAARWPAHSHTFGELPRLAGNNAVSGNLFFDLPPNDLTHSPVWLEWKHDGTTTRLLVPMSGVDSGSNHNH